MSDQSASQNKKELEKQLWNIANALRGNMSADEFRDYILGFIFYKYLSEKINNYANKILEADKLIFAEMDEDDPKLAPYFKEIQKSTIDTLGYYLNPSELFHTLAKKGEKGEFIIGAISDVLRHIEQSTMGTDSEDDFNGLFDDIDLTSNKLGKTEKAKNELISKVLNHLDDIDFQLENSEIDVLGDAYEYLIGKFASGAGKSAGEFYTPQEVSTLLAKLVTRGKTSLKSVYDPTCGSGSLLLRVAKEVNEVTAFYGQESNPTTYNLARMNMILHNVHYSRFDIQQDDTIENPQHLEKRFEAVVANPPFSANWSANSLHLTDERFADYGKLAPKTKADFAFLQHMVHQLDEDGAMAVVLPHGVLFRGAAEGHIRQFLIEEKNVLDAVIGLPANIFFGTSIPTSILVFKKHRENAKDILFIDASAHFEKASNQNSLRSEDITRIMDAVEKRVFVDKFAYVAKLDEIKENDYNLNIPRYVDTFEEEEPVDLEEVAKQLQSLEMEITDTNKVIAEFCAELGLTPPFLIEKNR